MAFSYRLVLFPSGKKSLSSVVNTGPCPLSSAALALPALELPAGSQASSSSVWGSRAVTGMQGQQHACRVQSSAVGWEKPETSPDCVRLLLDISLSLQVLPLQCWGAATRWELSCGSTAWDGTLPRQAALWIPTTDRWSNPRLREAFADTQVFLIHTYIRVHLCVCSHVHSHAYTYTGIQAKKWGCM